MMVDAQCSCGANWGCSPAIRRQEIPTISVGKGIGHFWRDAP
jgi:hypothetical protein